MGTRNVELLAMHCTTTSLVPQMLEWMTFSNISTTFYINFRSSEA